jgi:hypothetical protein
LKNNNFASRGTALPIASMQQEMYQSALHHFEEAKKSIATQGDQMVILQNLRDAISDAFEAIEATINQSIHEDVERNKKAMTQTEIDYWTEKTRHISIATKLTKGIKLHGGIAISQDSDLWKDFKEFKRLRDNLVHYRISQRIYYNIDELLEGTRKGILTASSIIKRIYLSHPENVSYPKVFDRIPP